MWCLMIVFSAGGFLAGILAQRLNVRLSAGSADLEARQAAFRAAGALLCQLDAGDFLARYVRTLRLLLRWLGGRCLQLSLQLAIVVCGYFLLTGVVSSFEWMTDEPAWHGDWMFSSSAMIGAALKSYLASS